MESSSSSPLERLLQLASSSSLHDGQKKRRPVEGSDDCNNKKPGGSTTLTLAQLVPVHNSLIQATSVAASGSNSTSRPTLPSYLTSTGEEKRIDLRLVVQERLCCSEKEATDCMQNLIAMPEASFADTLLRLQYLLYRLKQQQSNSNNDASPFQGLTLIVLPFLRELEKASFSSRQHLETIRKQQAEWDDVDMDEFVNALLDAVFVVTSTSNMSNNNMMWLEKCLQSMKDHNDDWKVQCRVLVRIHQFLQQQEQEEESSFKNLVVEAVFETTQRALWTCSMMTDQDDKNEDDDDGTSSSLKNVICPVTRDLLPLVEKIIILESSSSKNNEPSSMVQEHVQALWESLWECNDNKSNNHLLVVTTTFLCTLLPSVLHMRLSTTTTTTTGQQQQYHPIQQEQLWQLIYRCCRQGVFSLQQGGNKWSSSSSWIQHSMTTSSTTTSTACSQSNGDDDDDLENAALLRRRGLYLLRTLVSSKRDKQEKNDELLRSWNQYVACMETIEMELEPHLVDQVWETVGELMAKSAPAAAAATASALSTTTETQPARDDDDDPTMMSPPQDVTWRWLQLLYARILTTRGEDSKPILRKSSLLALFQGRGGILLQEQQVDDDKDKKEAAPSTSTSQTSTTTAKSQGKNKKKKQKQKQSKKKSATATSAIRPGAPLKSVSNEFILHILMPAFDSLEQSGVGTHMHYLDPSNNNKGANVDLDALLLDFLNAYWNTLSEKKWQDFVQLLFRAETICTLRSKTMTILFERVAAWWLQRVSLVVCDDNNTTTCSSLSTTSSLRIPMEQATLESVATSLSQVFSFGSIVRPYRESLLQSLSIILARSKPAGDSSCSPLSILGVLNLYTLPNSLEEQGNGDGVLARAATTAEDEKEDKQTDSFWMDKEPKFVALGSWLGGMSSSSNSWKQPTMVASTLASAFVDGHLLAVKNKDPSSSSSSPSSPSWDPLTGASVREREMGRSIVLLCTLITNHTGSGGPSELLWPAINKGLVNVPMVITTTSWPKADRIARALVLLEVGCRVQVLSGTGNGDLIVDRKTQGMMPPPPSIEQLLAHAIAFCLHHLRHLMSPPDGDSNLGCTRSGTAKRMSSTLADLLSLLRTLKIAFPSSMAISDAVDQTLKSSFETIRDSNETTASALGVKNLVVMFATLTCGAAADCTSSANKILEASRVILKLQTPVKVDERWAGDIQPLRSVFQYAKWGTLSCLLPDLLDDKEADKRQVSSFVDSLLDESIDAVQATTTDAIVSLFDCVVVATRHFISDGKLDNTGSKRLATIIKTLFAMMEDTSTANGMYMLDEISRLVFQPSLLMEEYERFRDDPDCLTPIRDAFRHTVKTAKTSRPHIIRAALCWIVPGWLGDKSEGLAAIPYREDILELLLYKEDRLDESSRNQSAARNFGIPEKTDKLSIVRAFVLVFLSRLPGIGDGLPDEMTTELVHFLILNLLEEVKFKGGKMIMTGTPEYCRKMRGWQALCVLSRFVSDEIAEQVCSKVFAALEEPLHGQTRYFIEVFCIQCARKHPVLYGKEISMKITRQNLSLQLVSSYMIIAGNLIVGRYKDDFMGAQLSGGTFLHDILAGAIPWVGSTQGFSRAIAQLLVHQLIPLVIDVNSDKSEQSNGDSEWYLRSLFRFLEENAEMKRLRQKQTKFFEGYDVDDGCTPEGVLSIPVDEGSEANPLYMVELVRRTLAETYEELHADNTPTWKQVKEILDSDGMDDAEDGIAIGDGVVNFQRKIVPIDSLNLALEEVREKKLRNFAGRMKQPLIVCASLIDKAPNLGGLARTSEIFAANSLVIPDKRVTKMDDYKNVSVSASDWISIDEVPPERLLAWLHARRDEGYFVVGVEQTFSSVKLSDYSFPTDRPTVLLLGKEKEGIPVKFLRAVDQCVEIPQLGVTRSLNVHVSAAISIWEYTRQRIEEKSLKV